MIRFSEALSYLLLCVLSNVHGSITLLNFQMKRIAIRNISDLDIFVRRHQNLFFCKKSYWNCKHKNGIHNSRKETFIVCEKCLYPKEIFHLSSTLLLCIDFGNALALKMYKACSLISYIFITALNLRYFYISQVETYF